MIYKSVYPSRTEDGESMTADTLHEDDPTTNTGVCKRVKEDSMAEEPGRLHQMADPMLKSEPISMICDGCWKDRIRLEKSS